MTRLRLEALVVVLVAIACLGAWLRAAVHAVAPSPPVVLVYGPERVTPGEEATLLVFAGWVETRRRTPFAGELVGEDGVAAPVEHGRARVRMPASKAPGEVYELMVRGTVEAAPVDTRARLVAHAPGAAPAGALGFVDWRLELKDRTEKDLAGPPLYPTDGSARSSLETRLLTLEDGEVKATVLAPNAANVRAPDGRALRIDRSALSVRAPLVAAAGADLEVTVRASEARPVYADLLVDGVHRDLAVWRAAAGESRHRVRLPADAARWYALRVTESPYSGASGPSAVGFVQAFVGDGAPWAAAVEGGLVAAGDPLLRHAAAGEVEGAAVDAALQARLRPPGEIRPRLSEPGDEQLAEAHARRAATVRAWLWPFRALGLLLVVLTTRVAVLAGRRPRRALEADEPDEDDQVPRRPLSSLVWGSVAFVTSLAILWVLDWALTFALVGVEA